MRQFRVWIAIGTEALLRADRWRVEDISGQYDRIEKRVLRFYRNTDAQNDSEMVAEFLTWIGVAEVTGESGA